MKILITRPRAQADDFAEKLRSAGFEPIFFPVIQIQPIDHNIALTRFLEKRIGYDWLIFTSANAVDMMFPPDFYPSQAEVRQGVKVAAIGPKTAEALRKRGLDPDFVPEVYVAEAILPGLGNLQGRWVLLPRAEIARNELPEAILKAGGIVHDIPVYRTLPAEENLDGLTALTTGVDIITFTSASTVENFFAICNQNGLDPLNLPKNPLFACIGPVTERAAQDLGFQNLVVAKEYTTDGLLEGITRLEKP